MPTSSDVSRISSTLAWVMPNSSAWIVAMIAQLTTCAHCVSPSATAGASGSLENTSGRIVSASGPSGIGAAQAGQLARVRRPSVALAGDERRLDLVGVVERADLPVEAEPVRTRRRRCPRWSCPWRRRRWRRSCPRARRSRCRRRPSSPGRRRSSGAGTSRLRCRPGSPSTWCCGSRTSIAPLCSAVNRSAVSRSTNSTFVASPSTAAAIDPAEVSRCRPSWSRPPGGRMRRSNGLPAVARCRGATCCGRRPRRRLCSRRCRRVRARSAPVGRTAPRRHVPRPGIRRHDTSPPRRRARRSIRRRRRAFSITTTSSSTCSSISSTRPANNGNFGAGFPQASCGLGTKDCFAEDVFLDLVFGQSTTRVGVLSGLPIAGADSPLAIDVMDHAREQLASRGSDQRLLLQAPVFPATGELQEVLDGMAADAAAHPVAAWKTYTHTPTPIASTTIAATPSSVRRSR